MAIIKCELNVNDGVNVRSGPGTSYDKVALITQDKALDNKYIYVDNSSGKAPFWKLHDPSKYGLGLSDSEVVYVSCEKEWIKSPDPSTIRGIEKGLSDEEYAEDIKDMEIEENVSDQFYYSDELDNQIYEMLNQGFSYDDLKSFSRVMGAPFQFNATADYRVASTEDGYTNAYSAEYKNKTTFDVGRQYMENILTEAPILYLIPGVPSYLEDVSAKNKSILEGYLEANQLDDASVSKDAIEAVNSIEGRYFEFRANYAEYIKYVNLLCRGCAVYLGISDRTVPGTTTKYKDYDWGAWTDPAYISENKPKDSDGIWDEVKDLVSSAYDEIFGDHRYLKCYVDPNVSISESVSNQTTESKFASLFDTMQGAVREINFLTNDAGVISKALDSAGAGVSTVVGGLADGVSDLIGSKGTNNLQRIVGMADQVLTGSNIVFPSLWGDSDYRKSYSFTVNLTSPYGDVESIYLNIIVPMMHILAMSCPRQTSANSFGSPFLVKMFAKGWFSCDMGMIDSVSIDKGANGSWNVFGLPTEVRISVSVTDLYSGLMIPRANQPELFLKNTSLIDFLAVTCGVNITKPHLAMKLDTIFSTYLNTLYDLPSNVVDSIFQGLRNSFNWAYLTR